MILTKDTDKLLQFIDSLGIEHLNAKGRILNESPKCYVDDIDNPSKYLLVDEYWILPHNVSKEELMDVIGSEKRRYIGFPAVTENMFAELKELGAIDWHNPCYLYYADVKFENHTLDEEFRLDSLKLDDAKTVDKYYTYRGKFSLKEIQDDIANRPSSVIRDKSGNPLSWVLVHPDNSLGIMFTKERFRQHGFGKIVSIDLINKVLDNNQIPFVHILTDNQNSVKLAKSVGMKEHSIVHWFGLKL